MNTRKLASLQKIEEIIPIPNADTICQYRVLGWKIVDRINQYKVDDLVIYCEIDSWIPTNFAPFLSKGKEPKEYNGIKGERLRTVKLRGALSQGLILPLEPTCSNIESELFEGLDVTIPLGIQKWEAPAEFISAAAKGDFPDFVTKTNQERIQNCYDEVSEYFFDVTFEVSEKVDGQSFTAYLNNGEFGVCSRNLELKESDNTFWNNVRKFDLENKLRNLGLNIAVQAEQTGPGINGNIYKAKDYYLFVFDIFDIDTQTYYSPANRMKLIKKLGLISVPILCNTSLIGNTLDEIVEMADGSSVLGDITTKREGLVFKANTHERISFKAVSNKYLLSEKS
jgi:RNA ligase (TIGR02306 family)